MCNPDDPTQVSHVSKATRGMHWGTAAKKYFKTFIDFSFIIPDAETLNSSRTSVFLPALNIIIHVFASKRFASFDFDRSLITQ